MPWLKGKHGFVQVKSKRQKESEDSIDENVDLLFYCVQRLYTKKKYCALNSSLIAPRCV